MFKVSKRPDIKEIHTLYQTLQAKPSEVINYFLNRSKNTDKEIHSVLRYCDELTKNRVTKLDKILEEVDKSDSSWFKKLLTSFPLFGIPFNLKDNVMVEGLTNTSASKIISNYNSTYSSTVYQQLEKAGAILISQSNQDEWAVGASTENSAFGPSKNPFDTSRVPGGSSGGPAANTASGQSVFSIGSDTGGSVRVPASFCDLVGSKPTYGMISRYGVMPLSSSLDQVGVFANTVFDNLLVNWVLYGADENDQTTVKSDSIKFQLKKNIENIQKKRHQKSITKTSKPIRIGVAQEYFVDGLDPTIEESINNLLSQLSKIGHTIVDVSLPLTKFGLAVYYTKMTVETASNLQRYDGIRYGQKDGSMFFGARSNFFGDEPKRRIMLGTFASSSGYFDQYYNKAVKVQKMMQNDFQKVFQEVDILLAPTSPEFAFKLGQKTSDPVTMYLTDALVYGANLTRIPAINVPLKPCPLPVGVQLISPEYGDSDLYNLGLEIEKIVKNSA